MKVLTALASATILAATSLCAASPAHSAHTAHVPRALGVVVTFTLTFQPDGSAQGSFTAAGDVNDAGPASARPVVTPVSDSTGRLEGSLRLYGSSGTLVWRFQGWTAPLGAPRALGHGSASVVEGTDGYLNGRWRGTFVTTADFIASTVTGAIEVPPA